jgi:serine phosphatase RsbU (regulator of sigma subunit)
MSPSFRSSGTLVSILEQSDGRVELVVAQVNIMPVTAADVGNFDLVSRAAIGTISDENESTMDQAEIIEALRYAADQLEAKEE